MLVYEEQMIKNNSLIEIGTGASYEEAICPSCKC